MNPWLPLNPIPRADQVCGSRYTPQCQAASCSPPTSYFSWRPQRGGNPHSLRERNWKKKCYAMMQLRLIPAQSSCPHLCWLCACPCPWSRRCSSAAGSGSPGTRRGPWQTCAHRPRGRTCHRCWQSSASHPCQGACRKSMCALLGREGIRNPDCKSQLWHTNIVQTNSEANRLQTIKDPSRPTGWVVTVTLE